MKGTIRGEDKAGQVAHLEIKTDDKGYWHGYLYKPNWDIGILVLKGGPGISKKYMLKMAERIFKEELGGKWEVGYEK